MKRYIVNIKKIAAARRENRQYRAHAEGKNVSEDVQKIPHDEAQPSRLTKRRRDEKQTMTKQMSRMKPPTHPNKHTTSLQRRCNVTTLQRRCNDVVATLYVCWDEQKRTASEQPPQNE